MDEKIKRKIVELRKTGMKPKNIAEKLNLHNIHDIRMICHKRGVSEPIRIKKSELFENLTLRAEAYWRENKSDHNLQKNGLAYLLIPKYGLESTQMIIKTKNCIKSDGKKMVELIFGEIK